MQNFLRKKVARNKRELCEKEIVAWLPKRTQKGRKDIYDLFFYISCFDAVMHQILAIWGHCNTVEYSGFTCFHPEFNFCFFFTTFTMQQIKFLSRDTGCHTSVTFCTGITWPWSPDPQLSEQPDHSKFASVLLQLHRVFISTVTRRKVKPQLLLLCIFHQTRTQPASGGFGKEPCSQFLCRFVVTTGFTQQKPHQHEWDGSERIWGS